MNGTNFNIFTLTVPTLQLICSISTGANTVIKDNYLISP